MAITVSYELTGPDGWQATVRFRERVVSVLYATELDRVMQFAGNAVRAVTEAGMPLGKLTTDLLSRERAASARAPKDEK